MCFLAPSGLVREFREPGGRRAGAAPGVEQADLGHRPGGSVSIVCQS